MTDATPEQRLANIEQLLTIFQATLDGQTDILRTQTEMLSALWRELTKEPGPSPAVQAIERLTQLLTMRLDAIAASVEEMAQRRPEPVQ